jgi:4-hydroxythreonine-4-phosphate dehydrogenase
MKKKIAITIGDPAGVGPEIVVKALINHPEIYESAIPVVFGHRKILEREAKNCGIEFPYQLITGLDQIKNNRPSNIYIYEPVPLLAIPESGRISGEAGKLAFEYIRAATHMAMKKQVDSIATAPISKEAMRIGQIPYLDHTDILTKLTDSRDTMTLFVTKKLWVFFYSRHIAFKDISASLDTHKIVDTLRVCAQYLEKIGIKNPKLALASLNPHSGESGMFGQEEIEILIPAVQDAQKSGISVEGPISADSVFHLAKEGLYDAVLSLYHDQGHIATKTYDFYHTISLTMGLPFLRTSVDHGTAMDMAGKNKANEISMVEAIKAAAKYAW